MLIETHLKTWYLDMLPFHVVDFTIVSSLNYWPWEMCSIYFHPDVVASIVPSDKSSTVGNLVFPSSTSRAGLPECFLGWWLVKFQVTWKWYLMLSDLAAYNLPHYNLFSFVVIHPGLVQCWLSWKLRGILGAWNCLNAVVYIWTKQIMYGKASRASDWSICEDYDDRARQNLYEFIWFWMHHGIGHSWFNTSWNVLCARLCKFKLVVVRLAVVKHSFLSGACCVTWWPPC